MYNSFAKMSKVAASLTDSLAMSVCLFARMFQGGDLSRPNKKKKTEIPLEFLSQIRIFLILRYPADWAYQGPYLHQFWYVSPRIDYTVIYMFEYLSPFHENILTIIFMPYELYKARKIKTEKNQKFPKEKRKKLYSRGVTCDMYVTDR